jgi:proteasome lid subunit RPN8/RPN11
VRFVPSLLRLNHQCLTVLDRTLAASSPEEGCGLLLGPVPTSCHWTVSLIWACCNVWIPARDRRSCFALDPREQLSAQRWARAHQLRVLGVAHSHPERGSNPSTRDRTWGIPRSLMVIRSAAGDHQAWWLRDDRGVLPVPIKVWDTLDAPGLLRS